MSKKTSLILVCVLFAICIGLITYGFMTQPEDIRENLPRITFVVAGFIVAIYRIAGNKTGNSKGLSFYEKFYSKEIGNAFAEDKVGKKKLLTALKYYNEDRFDKAEKILNELADNTRKQSEQTVCGLFLGACYSDNGKTDKAVEHYENLIEKRLENDIICNNLGLLYKQTGRPDKATELFERAVKINPDLDIAYNNLADIRFDEEKFDEAIDLAETALSKNSKLREASNLLAIIYNIKGDKERADKYYRMSVKNGQNGPDLKLAMSHYKNVYDQEDEE